MAHIHSQSSPPAAQDHPAEAGSLLETLSAVETHTDSLVEKLEPFDKDRSALPPRELGQLREGLKRVATRVGVTQALVERIAAEQDPEAASPDGSKTPMTVTPEDVMFPVAGLSDPITGLPARSMAEKALESALNIGRPRYAAVFALDRMYHMSSRYGVDVGNQALGHFAQFLTHKLPSDSLMFRWRGAAFLAVFDISDTLAEAKLLVEHIVHQKQKLDFTTNHRTAMVTLSSSIHTIALADHPTAGALIGQIDHFIEAHSGRQPH